tara:strand:+ start:14924 stop:15850 length:927 start_codon:yes stop_codon:yes gene_type:complete
MKKKNETLKISQIDEFKALARFKLQEFSKLRLLRSLDTQIKYYEDLKAGTLSSLTSIESSIAKEQRDITEKLGFNISRWSHRSQDFCSHQYYININDDTIISIKQILIDPITEDILNIVITYITECPLNTPAIENTYEVQEFIRSHIPLPPALVEKHFQHLKQIKAVTPEKVLPCTKYTLILVSVFKESMPTRTKDDVVGEFKTFVSAKERLLFLLEQMFSNFSDCNRLSIVNSKECREQVRVFDNDKADLSSCLKDVRSFSESEFVRDDWTLYTDDFHTVNMRNESLGIVYQYFYLRGDNFNETTDK